MVIQGHVFGDQWKLTRDIVSLYNNADLISKVSEDTVSENTENCRCRQPHCRLTSPAREPPHIWAKTLYCQKLELLYYSFAADIVRLHSAFHSGFGKRVFWNRVRNGCSALSMTADFGAHGKRICNFLLVINSNTGPILPHFRDIAGFLLRTSTPPLFHRNFETRSTMFGLRGVKTLS